MENINKATKTVVDPVCGMKIDPDRDAFTSTYKGESYHFCSEICLKQFGGHEQGFLDQAKGKKKGWWARYLEKLKKQEGDVRSCCH
jgi:YHS domain-containing protein